MAQFTTSSIADADRGPDPDMPRLHPPPECSKSLHFYTRKFDKLLRTLWETANASDPNRTLPTPRHVPTPDQPAGCAQVLAQIRANLNQTTFVQRDMDRAHNIRHNALLAMGDLSKEAGKKFLYNHNYMHWRFRAAAANMSELRTKLQYVPHPVISYWDTNLTLAIYHQSVKVKAGTEKILGEIEALAEVFSLHLNELPVAKALEFPRAILPETFSRYISDAYRDPDHTVAVGYSPNLNNTVTISRVAAELDRGETGAVFQGRIPKSFVDEYNKTKDFRMIQNYLAATSGEEGAAAEQEALAWHDLFIKAAQNNVHIQSINTTIYSPKPSTYNSVTFEPQSQEVLSQASKQLSAYKANNPGVNVLVLRPVGQNSEHRVDEMLGIVDSVDPGSGNTSVFPQGSFGKDFPVAVHPGTVSSIPSAAATFKQ